MMEQKKILDKPTILSRLSRIDPNTSRLLFILVAVLVVMTLLSPGQFMTVDNFKAIVFQFPEFGIIAIAMAFAMITGGIDLSIVFCANLTSILAAKYMTSMITETTSPGQTLLIVLTAILIAIAAGALCGLLNGLLISKIGIPAILATLGTMQVFQGIAIIITKGAVVSGFPEVFTNVGNGLLFGIPIPLFVFVIIAIIAWFLLAKTNYGLKLRMLGTNMKAARFSGLKNDRILILTYVMVGILAAIAGLLIASHTNSAKADYGRSYILLAILVSVMGGVNYRGGFGKISGIIIAVLSLQLLSTGLNILRVSSFIKDFIFGGLLILTMVLNLYTRKDGKQFLSFFYRNKAANKS